ncbi:hypothetical protein BH20ACT4_BH20ACT4_14660 [soil metagenome]
MLGLPRGGVVVADAIAEALDAPLDVVVVRKVGVPGHVELAMGAVGEAGVCVVNDDVVAQAGVSADEFERVADRERAELERRTLAYRQTRPLADLTGKTVILVDDGIATGATAQAALQVVRARNPQQIVLAVPVAPPTTLEDLAPLTDEIVALEAPVQMRAVGEFYRRFYQTTDAEVVELLAGRW